MDITNTAAATKESGVLVTYRRILSGRLHQVAFDCGADNDLLILKEAWNTRSEFVSQEPLR